MTQRLPPPLEVDLPGRHVGHLARDRDGQTEWLPDPIWEAADQHPRLGIAFLRKPGRRREGTGIPSWFENLLPERNSALRQRLCAVHGLRDSDSFRLLAAIGMDLSGAVEVSSPKPAGSQLTLETGVEAETESAVNDPPLAARLRFSLAGMQLKFSMSMANERLVLAAGGPQGQWIVKLPGNNYPLLPEIEATTMKWAAAAGFEVPEHFSVSTEQLDGIPPSWFEGVPRAFAIKRFDRRDDGSKIHQEDLCQALEILPIHKYGEATPQSISLDGALRFVGDVAGESSAREMSRRIGFVIASGNGDAHLKNWSLLWGNAERPILSPCYDFVSTISWPDQHGWAVPGGPSISLGLGRERRFAHLDTGALSRHSALSHFPWAADEIMVGIEKARDSWASVESEAPSVMRDALAHHWKNVPILKSLLRTDTMRQGG